MTTTPAVDDFAYIRERLAELEGDKRAAEAPKAWPSYAGTEQSTETGGEIWGHYSAPETDCAWRAPEFGNVPIIWVQSYYPAIDEVLGLPVWAHSPALKKMPHRGFEICSKEKAIELNSRFAARGPWAVEYLKEEIDARCRLIESQVVSA